VYLSPILSGTLELIFNSFFISESSETWVSNSTILSVIFCLSLSSFLCFLPNKSASAIFSSNASKAFLLFFNYLCLLDSSLFTLELIVGRLYSISFPCSPYANCLAKLIILLANNKSEEL
jgi:hypothetical protein